MTIVEPGTSALVVTDITTFEISPTASGDKQFCPMLCQAETSGEDSCALSNGEQGRLTSFA